MAEQDIPNRASNMEKAEGDRHDEQNQEQPLARRPHPEDPTRIEDEKSSTDIPDRIRHSSS